LKKFAIIIVLLSTLFLTGCSMWNYSLSEDEEDVLAEYSADLLLQYDGDYTEGLIDRDDLITLTPVPTDVPATVTPTAAAAESTQDTASGSDTAGTNDTNGNTTANTELSVLLGNDAIKTTYQGFELYDSYSVGESSRIEPFNSASQLLIVTLMLQNNSDQQQSVSISQVGLTYLLDVDNGSYYTPSPSILLNDFQYLNVVIDPSSSQEALLVFEVPKSFSPTTMNLFMMKDSQTVIFKMK